MATKKPPADRLDLMQGTLDMLVLKTLVWGPTHGHGIAQAIEHTSTELRIDHGSLYPALQRLQQEGWIVAEWGTSENNRRAKYYELTAAGRKRLREETESWNRLASAIGAALSAQPEEA